ncbi:PREDICTED: sister chromatid cohesion protein DCC1 isoform X1 [Rhagoletis zephyria]|uniref:sister chromatid cohesion protein DCC1 isoform X1 n=1 Tax=Rhagoletis zephyria TaxID=28612 RepID=UPI0008114482|nr:PREDICTED: sister chromatid cohesion protein DCC1 isoform X1 [Rhagoletis zephyria]
MSESEMEVVLAQDDEEDDEKPYVRTLEDVQSIIKHAKLDAKNLTQVTQALYYPSASMDNDNLKLLELDSHMHQQIRLGQTLYFKGGHNEKIVLCTEEKTYDVKGAEISNSLLLVPDLKFAAATSTSPLKSPRTGTSSLETSLNDDDDDISVDKVLEQRKVLKIFHEYFECREIRPRYRKIYELLQLTRFSGPENEEYIDRKLLFTYNQLLDTVQCSRKQFDEGLLHFRVMEYDGRMRVLECEYEMRILNCMLALLNENSWPLDEVEFEETVAALEGIAPSDIVKGLFRIYTVPTEGKEGKFTYKEELVARIIAQNILQPELKFRKDEFMNTWQEAMPEGMHCDEIYLRALGIIDKEGHTTCIRSLVEELLPTNIHERMRILFKTKTRWTMDEMEPYIEQFVLQILTNLVMERNSVEQHVKVIRTLMPMPYSAFNYSPIANICGLIESNHT